MSIERDVISSVLIVSYLPDSGILFRPIPALCRPSPALFGAGTFWAFCTICRVWARASPFLGFALHSWSSLSYSREGRQLVRRMSPGDFSNARSQIGEGPTLSERRRAACVSARSARAPHALLARARTPSAREGRSRLPPPPAPPPPQSLQCASGFARRPFHASSDALIGRLAKQAPECVHKWVGAASASTSLPSSLPASVCGFGRVGAQCLAAGPSRRTLRWLVVVAPPRISWLPRVARSNALLHAPGPDPR